jgi:hypothetical protein
MKFCSFAYHLSLWGLNAFSQHPVLKHSQFMRFPVLTVTTMKMALFWDVSLCDLLDIHVCVIALMMEAVSSSETSVIIYQIARPNIPEDIHLHTCRSESVTSHIHLHPQSLIFLCCRETKWHRRFRQPVVPMDGCVTEETWQHYSLGLQSYRAHLCASTHPTPPPQRRILYDEVVALSPEVLRRIEISWCSSVDRRGDKAHQREESVWFPTRERASSYNSRTTAIIICE